MAEFPAEPSYRAALANTRANSAETLSHLGRPQEAEKAYRGAVELWQELSAEFPAEVEYLRAQAGASRGLGAYLGILGRLQDAEEAFREALLILEKLGDNPTGSEMVEAELLASTRRPREAEQHYGRALQMLEKRVAASPNDPTVRYSLASHQLRFAKLLRAMGRPQEADKLVHESIVHTSQLLKDFPHTPQYRAGLSMMEKNAPRDEELHRFRAEAEELLGIDKKEEG